MNDDDHSPGLGLRPAIRVRSEPNSPMDSGSGSNASALNGRRVNFPADDSMVTGYLEPPNPWEKALNTTQDELVAAYKAACEKHCIKPLPKLVQQLQCLGMGVGREECLSLKGEKLDLRHYEAMEEIFKRVQFKAIDVESTNLDDEASVALFDMIEYYESTEHLNISSNKNLSARGWQACARMLKKTHCLESLDAHNTGLNEQFMSHICRTLRTGSYLTALHLENCNLSGRACTFLMTALKLNSTLRELYLAENKLSSTDALQIGNLLRANTKLQLMDLRNNHIQDTGVAHIVDGLSDQSMGPGEGLQTLVLWSNQLTFYSGNHLAKILATNRSLKTLNIGSNTITNEGVFHLKDALVKNRSLQLLGLQATRITCEGAVALAEYIADNPLIQQIDLRDNNIKVAGLLALSHSMKVNNSVTRLDLDTEPKKESKELQEQHQQLLVEITECCERNKKRADQLQAEEEERLKALEAEQPGEKLSESVCRLLSLWDQAPQSPKGLGDIGNHIWTKDPQTAHNPRYHSTPIKMPSDNRKRINLRLPNSGPSTPTILLPGGDTRNAVLGLGLPRAPLSGIMNPSLLSPPAACPSPPKSRFRVSRVDSDSVPSSAGSTPMPSPVPSPGHTPLPSPACTPLPSPGCTPLPSPVPSPIGSPVSSPCRVLMGNGIPASIYSSIVLPKACGGKLGNIHDEFKRRVHKPRFVVSQHSLPESSERVSPTPSFSCVETSSITAPIMSSATSVSTPCLAVVSSGTFAPPSSPVGSYFFTGSTMPMSSTARHLPSPVSPTVSMCSDLTVDVGPMPLECNFSVLSAESMLPNCFTLWDTPPNTPAGTVQSELSYSLSLTDDTTDKSPSLSSSTSSNSSSESVITSDSKYSAQPSISWVESASETDLSALTPDHTSPMSESSVNLTSYPSATSVNSPYGETNSESATLSKDEWPAPPQTVTSNSFRDSTDISPSSTIQSTGGTLSWDGEWEGVDRNSLPSPCTTPSGAVSCNVSCSESFVSENTGDGGLTPQSELSAFNGNSNNSVELSFAATSPSTGNGSFRVAPSAPPCSPVDALLVVPQSATSKGAVAPPSTPEDMLLNIVGSSTDSDSAAVTVVENQLFNVTAKKDSQTELCEKTAVADLQGAPLAGSEFTALPTLSLTSALTGGCSSETGKTDSGLVPIEINRSPTSPLSPTSSSRFRQIRLAEPSCVRLFGGGRPHRSTSPSPTVEVPSAGASSVFQDNVVCGEGHLEVTLINTQQDNTNTIPSQVETNVTPDLRKEDEAVADGRQQSCEVITNSPHLPTNVETTAEEGKQEELVPVKTPEPLIPTSLKDHEDCGRKCIPSSDENGNLAHPCNHSRTAEVKASSPREKAVHRRASTGSFPTPVPNVAKGPTRRNSMTIDDLIQVQLMELHFLSLRLKENQSNDEAAAADRRWEKSAPKEVDKEEEEQPMMPNGLDSAAGQPAAAATTHLEKNSESPKFRAMKDHSAMPTTTERLLDIAHGSSDSIQQFSDVSSSSSYNCCSHRDSRDPPLLGQKDGDSSKKSDNVYIVSSNTDSCFPIKTKSKTDNNSQPVDVNTVGKLELSQPALPTSKLRQHEAASGKMNDAKRLSPTEEQDEGLASPKTIVEYDYTLTDNKSSLLQLKMEQNAICDASSSGAHCGSETNSSPSTSGMDDSCRYSDEATSNDEAQVLLDGVAVPLSLVNDNDVSLSASVIKQRLVGNGVQAECGSGSAGSTRHCSHELLDNSSETTTFYSPVQSPCGTNGLNLNLCFLENSQPRRDATELGLAISSPETVSPETLST